MNSQDKKKIHLDRLFDREKILKLINKRVQDESQKTCLKMISFNY